MQHTADKLSVEEFSDTPMLKEMKQDRNDGAHAAQDGVVALPLPPTGERDIAKAEIERFAACLDDLDNRPSFSLAVDVSGHATSAFARVWFLGPSSFLSNPASEAVVHFKRFVDILHSKAFAKTGDSPEVLALRSRAATMVDALELLSKGKYSAAMQVAKALH